MKNFRAANRYAKALMDLAKEQNLLDQVHADAAHLEALSKESKEFRTFLSSPIVREKKKTEILESIFGSTFQELTMLFVGLVIQQGRTGDLPLIATEFIKMYSKEKGILEATVVTATALTEQQRTRIMDVLRKLSGEPIIVLSEEQDANILGGMQIRVGDLEFNGSLRDQLNKLRHQYSKNVYEPDYI